MNTLNDVDILRTLNPHGWSTVYLTIDQEIFEFSVTHVFNNSSK